MSFYREKEIKATRKDHLCQVCHRKIEAGSPALYLAGMNSAYDGIWHGHFHHDCRAAEIAFNNLVGWRNGDEWALLSDADREDRAWLAEKHPTVAARMFPAVPA